LCCPYCGEADHQRLGFLAADNSSETRRVETCASCKGYVKTLATLQATPPYAVTLADLATVDLDVVALERGYTRPERPGYALGICLVDSPPRLRTLFGRQR
jgi:FdhE protein